MREQRRILAALLAGVAALAITAPATAQDWKEFRSARQTPADLETLQVELAYGAGRLAVEPASPGFLYDLRVQYDAERFLPVRNWAVEDGRGNLRISLTGRESSEGRRRVRLDGGELDVSEVRRLGDAAGRLQLGLGRSVPIDLAISVGAAESELQLGGLSLVRLSVETGASDTRVAFDQANPVRMKELELRAGAASFRAEGLGNANFERFRFRGGVGDVTLDFTGRWEADARGSIGMGVGALRLRLPRELGVRIRKSSFLTAFDAREFVQVDGGWQTENWSSADVHLELDLDAAFGSITVERVP